MIISGQRQRPRSNTARSYSDRAPFDDESPVHEKAPPLPIRGGRDSPNRNGAIRPSYSRTATSDSLRSGDEGQAQGIYKLVRIPTEPTALVQAHRGNLRSVSSNLDHNDGYDKSDSPMSRASTTPSRTASWSAVDTNANGSTGPKKTIPPPINRAKKPPPPPPPMKRSALSTSQIPHY
jgi:hypothetical protein